MKIKIGLAAALLTVSGVSQSYAADEVADVTKEAVDPYNPGAERSRFLSAAGVDSELSEEEFTGNLKATDPFVRKFDNWGTLKGFDRNGNKTIDWFEADGYRRAIRTAVLATFDKDKDGSLGTEERALANKDLAAGKLPKITIPTARPTTPGGNGDQPRNPGDQPRRPGNGDNPQRPDPNTPEARAAREAAQKETRQRYETFIGEYTKANDKDGDGKLTIAELDAARAARLEELKKTNPDLAARIEEGRARDAERDAERLKRDDKDGDGKLSEEEQKAAREARMAEFKQRDPEAFARFEERAKEWESRRAEFDKQWDTDGDGKLSDVERRLSETFVREDGRKRMEELTKKYDKDGNGELSREEREELFRNERNNLPFGGGRGNRGGGNNGGNNNQPRGNQPNRGDL